MHEQLHPCNNATEREKERTPGNRQSHQKSRTKSHGDNQLAQEPAIKFTHPNPTASQISQSPTFRASQFPPPPKKKKNGDLFLRRKKNGDILGRREMESAFGVYTEEGRGADGDGEALAEREEAQQQQVHGVLLPVLEHRPQHCANPKTPIRYHHGRKKERSRNQAREGRRRRRRPQRPMKGQRRMAR